MSSIIETSVIDGAGKGHGEFSVELPDVPIDWRMHPPGTHKSTRFITEPFTNNVFRVSVEVEYVGESV